MYYRLVLINTEKGIDQSSWTLQLPTTVGRGPEFGVSINHESISRTHCKLFLNAHDALTVRDISSTNGTYVNDQRVTQATLAPGDILQLGSITLRIEYTSDTDHGRKKPKQPTNLGATQPMAAQPMAAQPMAAQPMAAQPVATQPRTPQPIKPWQSGPIPVSKPAPASPPVEKKWWQFW